jgi:putative RecB family exonuclease
VIRRQGGLADEYRLQGEGHLATYFGRYHPFDGERTVAVERRVMFPLAEERKIWLQGYVDRISVTRDGLWQIHDYKTGRWMPTQEDLDADRQLALYQIGVQRDFPRDARRVELVWHYLAHDLELRSRREPEALERLAAETLSLIDTIQADTTFETVTGNHCDRCSYRDICPAWAPAP